MPKLPGKLQLVRAAGAERAGVGHDADVAGKGAGAGVANTDRLGQALTIFRLGDQRAVRVVDVQVVVSARRDIEAQRERGPAASVILKKPLSLRLASVPWTVLPDWVMAIAVWKVLLA